MAISSLLPTSRAATDTAPHHLLLQDLLVLPVIPTSYKGPQGLLLPCHRRNPWKPCSQQCGYQGPALKKSECFLQVYPYAPPHLISGGKYRGEVLELQVLMTVQKEAQATERL